MKQLAGYTGALGLVVALILAIQSWRVWTTRVTVGEQRIEWKRGTEYGSLDGKDVSALGFTRTGTGIRVGLVERGSGLLHPLPLLPRGLYQVLRDRFGRLPPEVEHDLFG